MIPGGTSVARIVAVGPDASSLKPGQLVYVHDFITSRDDLDARCLFGFSSGLDPDSGTHAMVEREWRDATLAEYTKVPLESCIPLDEGRLLASPHDGEGLGYTMEELAYLQIPLVAYGGLVDVDLKPGETVVVTPATGQFGGAAVQVALAMGAGRVIAMGRNESALTRVEALDKRVRTVRLIGDDWAKELKSLKVSAGSSPIDVFFDISPPEAQGSSHYRACLTALRPNGRASLMGVGELAVPVWIMVKNNLQLKGKWMYERGDIAGFMRLVNSGLLKLGQRGGNKITGRFKLEEWKEAFDMAAEKARVGQMTLMIP